MKVEGALPLDLDLPHVGDVEQPGGVAHRQMLFDHPAVLDRHLPAAEFHHPAAEFFVDFIQRRLFQHNPSSVSIAFSRVRF